jgi:RNA polymerase sigma factor (TIGR02999 family)
MNDDKLVTQLLFDWRAGNQQALEELMPMVYDTLRQLAGRYMRNEKQNHTLQATAIVNEAYMKLADVDVPWADRAHFIAIAAKAMRRILVDHARQKNRQKRGGDVSMVTLYDSRIQGMDDNIDVIELEEALEKLAVFDERKAKAIELLFFGGLTYDEIAEVLGVSAATVDRELRFAKAWLYSNLTQTAPA